jgi:hypothetical protein
MPTMNTRPAQRKLIDARLAKAEKEIKQGRTYGPFDTAEAMIRSMKEELKKRAANKKTTTLLMKLDYAPRALEALDKAPMRFGERFSNRPHFSARICAIPRCTPRIR